MHSPYFIRKMVRLKPGQPKWRPTDWVKVAWAWVRTQDVVEREDTITWAGYHAFRGVASKVKGLWWSD